MRYWLRQSLLFTLCLTLVACGADVTATFMPQQTPTSARTLPAVKPGKIEVDIFSGRPNPTSPLSGVNSLMLLDMVRALPRIPNGTFADPLGYRGLIARVYPDSTAPVTIRIFRGVVFYDTGLKTAYYQDDARKVEGWLLATTKTWLDPDLYDSAQADFNK